jgi:hypothetical protein
MDANDSTTQRMTQGWLSYCPLTGKSHETDTLAEAIAWFAAETLAWAARRWIVPLVVGVVLLALVMLRGRA